MTTWKPSVTPRDVIMHSQGPWEDHKYVKKVDELYHHGILGMQWGKRNGPPYPLDEKARTAAEKRKNKKIARQEKAAARKAKKRAKQAAVEKAKAEKAEAERQKVLKTGSLADVRKLKGNISEDEYAKVFKRLENEKRLDDFDKDKLKNTAVKIASAMSILKSVNEGTAAAVSLYNRGAAIYNTVAKAKNWDVTPMRKVEDNQQNNNNDNNKGKK